MASYSRILLVQTGFLGDLVLSTPLISALKELFPDALIDVLCTPQAVGFLRRDKNLNKVIPFDKRRTDSGFSGLLKKAKELRNNSYEVVFSLHKSYRTALLLYLSKIPIRYGFKEASLSFLYTKSVRRKDLPHEVLRNLAILRNINVEPNDLRFPLMLHADMESENEASLVLEGLKKPFITIAPGSVWATKRWTKEGFSELSSKLIELGKAVVIIGGPDDIESASFIEDEIKKINNEDVIKNRVFLNLVGKTPLMTSASIIKMSECLITNDSSPLHIACAVGTPVVSIFCATVPEFGFTPWMTPHRIIEKKDLSCRPCGSHGGHICPIGTNECQKGISSTQVLNGLKSLYAELGLNIQSE